MLKLFGVLLLVFIVFVIIAVVVYIYISKYPKSRVYGAASVSANSSLITYSWTFDNSDQLNINFELQIIQGQETIAPIDWTNPTFKQTLTSTDYQFIAPSSYKYSLSASNLPGASYYWSRIRAQSTTNNSFSDWDVTTSPFYVPNPLVAKFKDVTGITDTNGVGTGHWVCVNDPNVTYSKKIGLIWTVDSTGYSWDDIKTLQFQITMSGWSSVKNGPSWVNYGIEFGKVQTPFNINYGSSGSGILNVSITLEQEPIVSNNDCCCGIGAGSTSSITLDNNGIYTYTLIGSNYSTISSNTSNPIIISAIDSSGNTTVSPDNSNMIIHSILYSNSTSITTVSCTDSTLKNHKFSIDTLSCPCNANNATIGASPLAASNIVYCGMSLSSTDTTNSNGSLVTLSWTKLEVPYINYIKINVHDLVYWIPITDNIEIDSATILIPTRVSFYNKDDIIVSYWTFLFDGSLVQCSEISKSPSNIKIKRCGCSDGEIVISCPSGRHCYKNKCVQCEFQNSGKNICPTGQICTPYGECIDKLGFCNCTSLNDIICTCRDGPALFLSAFVDGCSNNDYMLVEDANSNNNFLSNNSHTAKLGSTILGFNYDFFTTGNGTKTLFNLNKLIDSYSLTYESKASNLKIQWYASKQRVQLWGSLTTGNIEDNPVAWMGFLHNYSISLNSQCNGSLRAWNKSITSTDSNGTPITAPDSITLSPGDILTLEVVINNIKSTKVYKF